MTESVVHDEAVELLKAILAWWAKGQENTRVARNLAVRWDEDFDRLLAGPRSHGGPFKLQVWERDEQGCFTRTYAGDGPAYSPVARVYLVPTVDGRKLRLADDPDGKLLWPTAEEAEREGRNAERTAREQERAAKEQERAAKEEALARVAALEAALATT